LDEQYGIARKLLESNKDKVEAMTAALLEYETIDADQINDIMAGNPVREPKPRQSKIKPSDSGTSSGNAATPVPQPTAKS
jgi:cell division protease FtsH